MRSVKFFVAAGAASLLSSMAFAADMSMITPAPMYYAPPAQDFGGWYLRGDIGMTTTNAKLHTVIYDQLSAAGTPFQQLGHGFDGGTSYGIGVGYKFNSWFRADKRDAALTYASAVATLELTKKQLDANLAASELELAAKHVTALDEASAYPLGYPYDFMNDVQKKW